MKQKMYDDMYLCQKTHWWFIARQKIICYIIKKYVKNKENINLLDIGCGSGAMLNVLKQYGKTTGLDNSDTAIKMSKSVFDGNIVQDDIFNEDTLNNQSFDCITILDVIEHMDKDYLIPDRIHKLLNENGICIVTVPAYMWLWSTHDDINEHKRRYTKKQLISLFKTNNLTIEKCSYYNTILFFPISFIRLIKKIFRIHESTSDMKMPNKFVNNLLCTIFSIEKFLIPKFNIPFGVSILMVIRKHTSNGD